jgi:chromosome segregation ATPase
LEQDLRDAEDRNRELQRVQEVVQEKLESLRDERKSLQAQVAHLERQNARLVEQQRFCECELTSLRHVNRNAEATLSNVKKAFAEVRVALSETKSRIRRRTIENWPRLNMGLRGIGAVGEDGGQRSSVSERAGAAAAGEEKLAAAGLGTADNSDPEDEVDI